MKKISLLIEFYTTFLIKKRKKLSTQHNNPKKLNKSLELIKFNPKSSNIDIGPG